METLFKLTDTNLVIKHSGQLLIKNINMQICTGDIVFLAGLNGVGKSTFFKTLINFFPESEAYSCFSEGKVEKKVLLQNWEERVIFIPQQDYVSYSFKTVKQVLLEGLLYSNEKPKKLLNSWLAQYEPFCAHDINKNILKKHIWALSGGELQYIKLIQSLLRCESPKVKIIIIDEPVRSLDATHIAMVSNLILRIHLKKPELAIMMSSHCRIFPYITKAYEIIAGTMIPIQYKYNSCLGNPDLEGFYKI